MKARVTKVKVYLDLDKCIGCAVCNKVCPDVFGMEEEALGVAKLLRPETDEPCVKEAKESCPVGCIRMESEV